jgi:uncharacterized iron-regulated protein
MRTIALVSALAVAGCTASVATTPTPSALQLPEAVVVLTGRDGSRVEPTELLRQLAAADLVLLGELHDNATHHAVRGQLIAASRARRPAIVFEQFAETRAPLSLPAEAESREGWLDRSGFDRQAWKWPLHQPVVDAAIAHGASLWGSGVTREALRSVVRDGESAAPPHLRSLLEQAPLAGAARDALDRELVAGHCGQLPQNMVAGMRAAQTVRDAAMARALMSARASGAAWLIAGNGHVRRDFAVPRLLQVAAPGLTVVVVGFLERPANDGGPAAAERALYDFVVVTPPASRSDPCAGFRVR